VPASSLGAEDMVLTDLIVRERLDIEIFSLDTGRLPLETYDLIAKVKKHYGLRCALLPAPRRWSRPTPASNGINAFYESVELRKAAVSCARSNPCSARWPAARPGSPACARAIGDPRRTCRAQFRRGQRPGEVQPARRLERTRSLGLHQAQRGSLQRLHDKFYPSIGCAPCTRPITPGEDVRAGRWWWENPESKECGLHVKRA
jgi:phosphoadenosine phosphosulfate reductase